VVGRRIAGKAVGIAETAPPWQARRRAWAREALDSAQANEDIPRLSAGDRHVSRAIVRVFNAFSRCQCVSRFPCVSCFQCVFALPMRCRDAPRRGSGGGAAMAG
jgi:hypothetical protein